MPLRERWLVTGSREGFTREEVWDGLDSIHGIRGFPRVTIVHGNCRGVDTFAKEWALNQSGGKHEQHDANWSKFGGAAGPIRNKEMVLTNPDVAVAFRYRDSPGTTHCISEIKKKPEIEFYEFEPSS